MEFGDLDVPAGDEGPDLPYSMIRVDKAGQLISREGRYATETEARATLRGDWFCQIWRGSVKIWPEPK